jgi:uncharacterized metal-binding protein
VRIHETQVNSQDIPLPPDGSTLFSADRGTLHVFRVAAGLAIAAALFLVIDWLRAWRKRKRRLAEMEVVRTQRKFSFGRWLMRTFFFPPD